MKIMALLSPLYNYYTIKAREIIFIIFISNLLLLYSFKSDIFNLLNVLSVLATVAAAAFAATEVYEVIITYVRAGFLSLFIIFFISWSYPSIPLLYLFLSYPISLIIVFN